MVSHYPYPNYQYVPCQSQTSLECAFIRIGSQWPILQRYFYFASKGSDRVRSRVRLFDPGFILDGMVSQGS